MVGMCSAAKKTVSGEGLSVSAKSGLKVATVAVKFIAGLLHPHIMFANGGRASADEIIYMSSSEACTIPPAWSASYLARKGCCLPCMLVIHRDSYSDEELQRLPSNSTCSCS